MSWFTRQRSGRSARVVCAPIVARQAAFSWVARRQPAVVLPFRVQSTGSWSPGRAPAARLRAAALPGRV